LQSRRWSHFGEFSFQWQQINDVSLFTDQIFTMQSMPAMPLQSEFNYLSLSFGM
jgi:hypothetical protein